MAGLSLTTRFTYAVALVAGAQMIYRIIIFSIDAPAPVVEDMIAADVVEAYDYCACRLQGDAAIERVELYVGLILLHVIKRPRSSS